MKPSVHAVIGLGFGDEGKGITTDYLCSQFSNPLVVRFNGGHQAGHTIFLDGVSHVFSNFGSGTLRDVPTFWSKYCTVDPVGIMNEFNVLKAKTTKLLALPFLYIDPDCPVTTPYDKIFNQLKEIDNLHGSCGVGFGTTIEREQNHCSLTFADLFYPTIFSIKLQFIIEYYGKKINNSLSNKQLLIYNKFHQSRELEFFSDACEQITKKTFVDRGTLDSIYCENYIFEGAQGLLLDQNFGFFPHVSRSNCGSKNIVKLLKDDDIEYYLITRAYQVRHGNGPMTNENIPHNIKENPDETNVEKPWQGKFRRSLLDVDLLKYAISKDKNIQKSDNKILVITCLDHIVDEYRFTYEGKIVYSKNENEFVKRLAKILNMHKVLTSSSPESKNFKHLIF